MEHKKWQYYIYSMVDGLFRYDAGRTENQLESLLGQLGREGWELCGTFAIENGWLLAFKRPLIGEDWG